MTLTLKEGLNTQSVILRHKILIQATNLLTGREGVLETEKDLYLILALLDNVMEEDVVDLCNQDERQLSEIMEQELEPIFFNLIKEERFEDLYLYTRDVLLDRCQEIWDNQHSVIGVMDALLTVIGSIDDKGKADLVEKAVDAAKYVEEKRTEKMAAKADEANSKLEELIQTFQKKEGQPKEESNV